MSNGRSLFTGYRLVAFAALLGIVAGGIAVYVKGDLPGNNADPAAASTAVADAQCAARTEAAKAVGDAATGDVAAMLAADPPQSLGFLAFDAADGRKLTVADLAGKTILLNLWATWCAPCRAEMPALDALQAREGGGDFEVVAVNVDTGDAEKPEKFLREIGIGHLAHYRDPSLKLFNDLKKKGLALGLPVTLLIGGDGCLLAHMNGPAEWAGEDAARLVKAARGAGEADGDSS